MNIRSLDGGYSVCEQIRPEDVAAIAKAGYRSIICNRPDGEGADQPAFSDIEKAATAAGISAAYLPIVPGQMEEAHVQRFAELMRSLPGPVFGFCRSGARAASLWDAALSMRLFDKT